MVSTTRNKLITLYHDKNFIEVRNLYSDVNMTASIFVSPGQVSVPRQGCNCSCFNSDQSILYFVDNSFYLMAYNLGTNSVSPIGLLTFIHDYVVDCYFDEVDYSVVMVKQNLRLKKFDLNQLGWQIHFSGASSFHVDATNKYITMEQGAGVINIY